MREIRGLDVNGKWHYGYYWKSDTKHYIRVLEHQPNPYEWTDYEVIPETVGQYTGLKDKNANEIYEGDICKTEQYGLLRIKWQDDIACFMGSQLDDTEEINPRIDLIWTHRRFEIIGNIHENKELLGETK